MSVKSITSNCCPPFLKSAFSRVQNSPIGYRLAKGMFWSIAGAVISRGLMLVATVLVARMLRKTGYGELGMIQSTVGMFGVFAGFGLGLTATKHVAEFYRSNPERAGRIIGLSGLAAIITGSLMALGLFIFAPWLAEHTINAPQLAGGLRISALILFLNALIGAQTGALSGFEAFKAIAFVNLFVGLISFPILVCGTWFGGLTGAIWALAINLAVNWLFNYLALRKEARRNKVPITIKKCSYELSILWKFSFPAVLSGALVGPVYWVCSALLANQPDGYGELGIFNAANQWRVAILFIPGMISQVALPMLSNLNGPDDRSGYFSVLKINVLISGGAAMAVAVPIAIASLWIMDSYGPGFKAGRWVLIWLVFSAVLNAVNSVVGQAIISKGRMWIGVIFNSLWAIALIIGSYYGIHSGYGAIGLAMATLIAYLLHSIWQSAYVYSLLRVNSRRRTCA